MLGCLRRTEVRLDVLPAGVNREPGGIRGYCVDLVFEIDVALSLGQAVEKMVHVRADLGN